MADKENFLLQKEMPSFKFKKNTIKVKNAMPKGRRDNEIVLPELAMSKKSIDAPKNKNIQALISIRMPAI
jgi:hypothetical protein